MKRRKGDEPPAMTITQDAIERMTAALGVPPFSNWPVSAQRPAIAGPESAEKSATPIIAYRRWLLGRSYPDGYYLGSVNSGERWQGRKRFEAVCNPTRGAIGPGGLFATVYLSPVGVPRHDRQQAPADGCHCGVYALREKVDVGIETGVVVGTVALWGNVIEHTDGYRAQYAYPQHLVLIGGNPKIAGELAFTYGVDCECWA